MKSKKSEDSQSASLASSEDAARKFRALLHHANDLVYSVSIDPDERTWRLEFLSDRIFDFSGCSADEFIAGRACGHGGAVRPGEPRGASF